MMEEEKVVVVVVFLAERCLLPNLVSLQLPSVDRGFAGFLVVGLHRQ